MTSDRLDDNVAIRQVDKSDMLERIRELPAQMEDGWRIAQGFSAAVPGDVANIVLLGMGGSAIGGDLARSLLMDRLRVPMHICREYDVPEFVGPSTLVLAASYSGNTEETLSAFQQCLERHANVIAITTGGQLEARAVANGLPVVKFAYSAQPRAAIGYSFSLSLGLLSRLGLVGDLSADFAETVRTLEDVRARMDTGERDNPAKTLARQIAGKIAVVYGHTFLSEVARRWKGQINENSKAWAFYELFPELNHNAVVGYEYPAAAQAGLSVIFLETSLAGPRIRKRIEVTKEILDRRGIEWHSVEALGRSPLANMMSTLYIGDWVSYYLAILHGADPTPVETIAFLKERLAQS